MNWYLKYDGTGAISGPMSQNEAERCSELGLIFSEELFSPKFSVSSEVEELLAGMRSVATAGIVIPHVIQEVMLRAIDAITLLSREKSETPCTSEDVNDLLIGLNKVLVGDLRLNAIDTITHLSREKSENEVIECSLDGGLFDVDSSMPIGVTIRVRDYDIEGYNEEGDDPFVEDSEGRECLVREYARRE